MLSKQVSCWSARLTELGTNTKPTAKSERDYRAAYQILQIEMIKNGMTPYWRTPEQGILDAQDELRRIASGVYDHIAG